MSSTEIRKLIAATAQLGFEARLGSDSLHLEGKLAAGDRELAVAIEFASLALVEAPRFLVRDLSELPRPVVPHIDENGEICVVERGEYIFDRYHAAEQVLGLIERAQRILADATAPGATAEIAAEFGRYWSMTAYLIGEPGGNIVTLQTPHHLSFNADQARPDTLGELLDWAQVWDSALPVRIRSGFATQGADDPVVAIEAPNGLAIVQLEVSKRGPVFQRSLARPKGWQRYLAGQSARELLIARRIGWRVDVESVLDGNGVPLAGKVIVLAGCGAIGGYLARMLVQLGAGFKSGRLILVDQDRLDANNVRRHTLGFGQVGQIKAEALAASVIADFPGAAVKPRGALLETQTQLLEQADLVIDSTGEQGLSEWLNSWAIERRRAGESLPTILHGWIAGHGAAAQSFISTCPDYACLRCLQPDHAERARYDPLREPPAAPATACGAPPSVPYGPQAAIAAASLMAQHVCDWANGVPHHLLRTARIDWKLTVKRDPVSPTPASSCPACGTP